MLLPPQVWLAKEVNEDAAASGAVQSFSGHAAPVLCGKFSQDCRHIISVNAGWFFVLEVSSAICLYCGLGVLKGFLFSPHLEGCIFLWEFKGDVSQNLDVLLEDSLQDNTPVDLSLRSSTTNGSMMTLLSLLSCGCRRGASGLET